MIANNSQLPHPLSMYEKVIDFLSQAGITINKLSLAGNNLNIPRQEEFGQ
jgi:hypothetical protein